MQSYRSRIPSDDAVGSRATSIRATARRLLFVLVLQSGCSTVSTLERDVPRTEHQGTLGTVAVIAASREPEIALDGFARSAGEGAAMGAGRTFLTCAGMMPGCGSVLCAPFIIVWLGACGVAGATGGVVGAGSAPSAGAVQAAEANWSAAFAANTMQELLRSEVAAAARALGTSLATISPESAQTASRTRDYRPLATAGVETVLEVALTKAGTQGSGIDAPLLAYMQAHARLVRVSDNSEIFAADYSYEGERLKLSEWSADSGKRLLNTLERGYQTLGAYIYDSVFRLYPFPEPRVSAKTREADGLGLGAIYPRTRGILAVKDRIASYFAWSTVDELRPTLRWEGFPREIDVALARQEMGRVKNVRYDLLIAREENLVPAEIIYHREELAESMHKIDTPLSPDTRYFWTVRAEFELDGRPRVTGWSSTVCCPGSGLTAPSQYSFRFKTP